MGLSRYLKVMMKTVELEIYLGMNGFDSNIALTVLYVFVR